jgi:predicted membrane channel-forming protein YqfA (hemolysin III family)
MTPSQRKLVGGFAMLAFVVIYALVAMALADSRPVNEAPGLVRACVYVVLGLAWVLPMMPLILWMERGKLSRR